MVSRGIEVELSPNIIKQLGNVSDKASFCTRVNKNGHIESYFEVGSLDCVEPLHDPGHMVWDTALDDMMSNFIAGNFDACNAASVEVYNRELVLDNDVSLNCLQESEKNMDYILYNNNDSILIEALKTFKSFNLLFPTKGSISRLEKSQVRNNLKKVYINKNLRPSYKEDLCRVCAEFKFKVELVDYNYKFNDNMLYYGSFSYENVKKCNIKNYICCEPNLYQAVHNEICSELNSRQDGYDVTYLRGDKTCVVSQDFVVKDKIIYGADSFYQHFRGSKSMVGGVMHDVYSSFYKEIPVDIVYGTAPLTHVYCLIGNYTHDRNLILDMYGNVVHVSNSINNSCKGLFKKWIIADSEGIHIQLSSYVIGAFSALPIFLGKKKFLRKIRDTSSNKYKDVIKIKGLSYIFIDDIDSYIEEGYIPDIVLVKDYGGPIKIGEECYSICNRIPHENHLMVIFGNAPCVYGTYHTLIRLNKVARGEDVFAGVVIAEPDINEHKESLNASGQLLVAKNI